MHELPVERVNTSEYAAAKQYEVAYDRVEYGLHIRRQVGNDAQYLCRRPMLLPRLGELTGARFELLFQFDQQIGPVANVRSRLRSGRTKLPAARWAICAFERQGHLVGTATGPPSGRPGLGSSLSILTEPNDELAPFHTRSPRRRHSRNGRYGIFGRDRADHSALMPANFTTLAHFSVSLARRRPKLAGGPDSIVPPMSASRAFALGSARIALISMLSRPMTSGGVFLGAMMPKNALAS